jgi:hypothetical protein
MVMSRLSGKVKELGTISVILIVVTSYALFSYLQYTTENNIKNRLFDQQKQSQFESTKALSEHISSDLGSVMARLPGLANSAYLQNGQVSDNKTKRLMEESYHQINSTADRLFILDKNNVLKINMVPDGQKSFIGTDISFIDWVRETRQNTSQYFQMAMLGLMAITG